MWDWEQWLVFILFCGLTIVIVEYAKTLGASKRKPPRKEILVCPKCANTVFEVTAQEDQYFMECSHCDSQFIYSAANHRLTPS